MYGQGKGFDIIFCEKPGSWSERGKRSDSREKTKNQDRLYDWSGERIASGPGSPDPGRDECGTAQFLSRDSRRTFKKDRNRSADLRPGVYPALVPDWKDTDEMLERSKRIPQDLGMTSKEEKIVIIAGVPISMPGTTNLIKVEIVE